jgi:hypothetical protein
MSEQKTNFMSMPPSGVSAPVSVHLAKAESFLEHRKPRKALHELWTAEASARGDAVAIQAMLEAAPHYEAPLTGRKQKTTWSS